MFRKKENKKKYGAHSHVRATARLVNTHYSQQRSAVRSTAPKKKIKKSLKTHDMLSDSHVVRVVYE